MKTLLRAYFYSLFTLWATTIIINSFKIKNGVYGFFYTAAIFSLLNLLVRPILKLILFPINLLTFGLLSWIINVIILYLLIKISALVTIVPWNFPGISFNNIVISAYHLNFWLTFIVTSFIIGIIVNLLLWLAK